jgi:hypothetical protein
MISNTPTTPRRGIPGRWVVAAMIVMAVAYVGLGLLAVQLSPILSPLFTLRQSAAEVQSPDGRWIATTSVATGAADDPDYLRITITIRDARTGSEVYVQRTEVIDGSPWTLVWEPGGVLKLKSEAWGNYCWAAGTGDGWAAVACPPAATTPSAP